MLEMTRWTSATAELWCGECGPHNGGGVRHVTDTLASSFWYVDALGALASRGFAQHGRQALVGSHYGLLAETTHLPNPDYWALLAWKRLMGVGVSAGCGHRSAVAEPSISQRTLPSLPPCRGRTAQPGVVGARPSIILSPTRSPPSPSRCHTRTHPGISF